MRTKLSGGNLSRKHFPKEAAYKKPEGNGCLPRVHHTLSPTPCSPALQANPEQALLHVWTVLVPCSLDALLHCLSQLPQLLDLPQVFVRLLAFFLRERARNAVLGPSGAHSSTWPLAPQGWLRQATQTGTQIFPSPPDPAKVTTAP